MPKDVENLEDMPSESEYYKTISNENFLAYKSDTMLIFMSKMKAQILYKKNEHIFIDGTFFSAPKAVYQVVTIRNHDLINDIFYTVAYGLLINKSMESYVEFLDQIKNYVYANRENKRILEYNDPINIHCDFEMAIIRAIKQVYPNTEIKLCLWHLYRNLELNRNRIYGAIENQNRLSLNILKRIKTLSFMDPRYIIDVYEFIKEDAEDNEKDTAFVNYFETTYLQKYDPNNWNYYRVFDHRTNNACESHNHVLNSMFNSKPTIWKFISIIREEEEELRLKIFSIREGEFNLRKKKFYSFKQICLKSYDTISKNIEEVNNSDIGDDIKKEKILNIWYDALLDFPIYDFNA